MNPQELVAVDRLKLLEFFDEAPASSSKHATSIVSVAGEELGLALLAHHFRGQGLSARVVTDPEDPEGLPLSCTPGTRRGSRLDGWVEAGPVLYQVEVKNWSAHAIGGRVLRIDAAPEEAARYRAARWGDVWDGSRFTDDSMNKVLLPMRRPYEHKNIQPLIAFWTALHPTGDPDPLFHVPLQGAEFSRVTVFSMSNYLRLSSEDCLELEMPVTCRRLDWLATLFEHEAGSGCGMSNKRIQQKPRPV